MAQKPDLKISYCNCKRYFENNRWKPFSSLKKLLSDKLESLYPGAEFDLGEVEIPEKQGKTAKTRLKTGDKSIIVALRLSTCSKCSRKGSDYYEAVIQVRCKDEQVLEQSVELLKKKVEQRMHKGVFINKAKKAVNGYDLYLSDKKAARGLARELREDRGGVLRESPELFTRDRQSSRNVYRLNILIRLPRFKKGDVIVYKEKPCLVVSIGKKTKLTELETGKSFKADSEELLDCQPLKIVESYVSRTKPGLEVINPLDFQSVIPENKPAKEYASGDKIRVVVHRGIFILD